MTVTSTKYKHQKGKCVAEDIKRGSRDLLIALKGILQ